MLRYFYTLCCLLIIGNLEAQTFNGTGGSIPDGGPEKCFPITVSGVGVINGSYGLATVCINITHTWDSDLNINLKAPDGTIIPLSLGNGGSGDNFTNTCFSQTGATSITATSASAPFTGTYVPEGNLGYANNGQNANGSWQLCILDDLAGFTGTLNSWSITFNNTPAAPVPPKPACGSNAPAGNTCSVATTICNFNGFCGNTSSSYTADYWPALGGATSGTGIFCGSIENNSFVKFVASSTTAVLYLWVSNSSLGYGIQMLFFDAGGGNVCNSSTLTSYGCYSPIAPSTTPFTVTGTGLTVGNTYYLMIDGYAGDVCDYTIAAGSGVNILNLSAPGATITSTGFAVCPGKTITLSVAGASGPYTWTGPGLVTNTGATVTAIPTGATNTYTVDATPVGSCPATATTTVTLNPVPSLGADQTITVCPGTSVNLTTLYNTTGLTTNWTFGGTLVATPTAVFAPGTYRLIARNSTLCMDTAFVTINNYPKPNLGADATANTCPGTTIDLTGVFNTTGYTSTNWTFGGTPVATPTAVSVAGTYQLIVTDANGCKDTANVVCSFNGKPNLGPDKSTSICSGAAADLTTIFSTGGLTTTWTLSGVTVSNPAAVTVPGVYQVIASGGTGCSDTALVTVTTNPKPTITITNPPGVCAPATVNLTAPSVTAGSTAGLTFTYFTDAAGTIPLASPAAVATSGTYYIKGVDGTTGCWDIKPVVVNTNGKPSIVITNPAPVCAPSTVNITVTAVTAGSSAGLTFSYFTNATATTVLSTPTAVASSGTYYIKGSTASGCADTVPVIVTINPQPVINITNPAAVCAPSTVDITAGAVTAGSTAGLAFTYYTNATATTALTTPAAVATSGTYYIVGSTAAGCKDTVPVTVTINPKPTVTITNPAPVCAPLTVNLTAAAVTAGSTAGLTYTYFTDAAATSVLSTPAAVATSGTYYIKGTTAAGCFDIKPVVVTISPLPTITITNPAAVCSPSTVDITAAAVTAGSTSGLTFTYYTNATATTVLATPAAVSSSGTYYIAGSTAAGCKDTVPVTVTINPKPTVSITNPAPVCSPLTVNLTVAAVTAGSTAGLTYTYFTDAAGTTVLTTPAAVTASGTYYIKGTTAAGCSDIKPVTVTINPKPTIVITNPAAVCAPLTVNITLSAVTTGSTAGLTYTYFTDAAGTTVLSTPAAVSASGTYYIKGTTATGCSDIKPVTVTINPLPSVVVTNPAAVCAPSTVDITASAVTAGSTAGLTFTYYTNATATTVLTTPAAVASSGTYYITGSTASGCKDTVPVTVTINPKPTVTVNNPAAVCAPLTVNLTAAAVTTGSTAGLTYTYFTNAAGTAVLSTPAAVAASGTYYIKGTTAAGCSDIKPVVVTINPLPTITITNPAAVCSPSTVDITAAAVTAGSTAGLTFSYFTNATATTVLTTPAAVSSSGTYYIAGSTVAGCKDTVPVTVTINPKPTVTITNPVPVCSPSTVNITAGSITTGSTAGLTFTYFTDAAGTAVLSSPAAVASSGVYYIKGTTAAGCSDIKPVTVTINPKPTISVTNPGPVCSPATVDITAPAVTSGSTAGLTLSYFSDPSGTVALTSPSAIAVSGTYYIKGVTAQGCSDIKPVTVVVSTLPVLVINDPAPVCTPSTVDITVAAVTAGSPAGLTYAYFNDAGAVNSLSTPASISSSGTYYIQGTNIGGCKDIKPVLVTVNPKPLVVVTNPAPICAPATIDITASAVTAGSTAGVTLSYFTDAAGTQVLIKPDAISTSGTYYIKGTTALGCSDIKPVVVTINAKPSLVITDPSSVCTPSVVNITLPAVTSGSTAGLTLSYFTDALGTSVLSSPAAVAASGTYYIQGTTSAGCRDIKPVTVTINQTPTVQVTDPAAVCAPLTIDITAAAITAGSTSGLAYTYFSDAAGTSLLASPAAISSSGTYYIKGSTIAGCSDIRPVIVTVNPKPSLTITNPAAVCSPLTVDITAAAVTAGSTAGLTLGYFSDAAGTVVLTSPAAIATSGTYFIKGSTAAGCTDIKPVSVTINAKPTVTTNNPTPVCAPATVDLTNAAVTSGSTAGLTYTYFTDAAGTIPVTTPASVNTSGTYYIMGTTAPGCKDIQAVTVTVNPKPSVSITNPAPVCAPLTIDITAAAVTAGSTAAITFTYFSDAAGSTVLASPSSISISGTYYIKGTTAAGCSDMKPVQVTINPKPTVVINNPSGVCSPSAVDLTAAAVTAGSTSGLAYTYFTDAAGTVSLATPASVTISGTYYIKGSTLAGCTDIQPVSVVINPKPTVLITAPAAVCAPLTIDITAAAVTAGSTNGLVYGYFSDAAATISLPSPAAIANSGTYFIKGSTGAGCTDIKPVVVTVNPKPVVVVTNPQAVCSPLTVDITKAALTAGSTNGLAYTYFSDAAATISIVNPASIAVSGTYYIQGTTAAGCTDIKPVTVTVNPKPSVAINTPAAVCSPATINITAASVTSGSTPGLTFTYFTDAAGTVPLGTPSAVNTTGIYYIKGMTVAGCSDIQPVTITVNPKPTVVTLNPQGVCSPLTVDITTASVTAGSTPGLTYSYFTDAAGTIPVSLPSGISVSGTYYIKGVTAAGCTDMKPLVVTVNPKPTLVITDPQGVCAPSSVNLTSAAVTAGSTSNLVYTYYTDAAGTVPVVNPNAVTNTGVFFIKGTTAAGCSDIQQVNATVHVAPIVDAGNDSAICFKTNALLHGTVTGASSPLTYSWTPSAGLTDPSSLLTAALPGGSTVYTLTVKANYPTCTITVTDQVKVTMQPPVPAYAGPDANAVLGAPYQLNATGGVSYDWSPASLLNFPNISNPQAILSQETKFIVKVTDRVGCIGYDSVVIRPYKGPAYYVPNAFSPNNDGLNDVFHAIPVGVVSTEYFRVYNRYGQIVFETAKTGQGWDGTFKGEKQPPGNYVWMVKGKGANGIEIFRKGNVVLVR